MVCSVLCGVVWCGVVWCVKVLSLNANFHLAMPDQYLFELDRGLQLKSRAAALDRGLASLANAKKALSTHLEQLERIPVVRGCFPI